MKVLVAIDLQNDFGPGYRVMSAARFAYSAMFWQSYALNCGRWGGIDHDKPITGDYLYFAEKGNCDRRGAGGAF